MQVDLQKREDTQTTILALLLTRKGGHTLRQLNNEYYDLEGEHIPWKELGYNSLLSLLYSMSKTVQIKHQNNTIIIQGIASEKSKHVSELVAGQKVQKQLVKRKVYRPNHYFPTTAPPRIRIPAEILSKIINIINDHPDGINKDYVLNEIHLSIPFANITMKDMEEQLQELSHMIFQTNNKIYPIQSKVKNFNNAKDCNDISHSKSKSIMTVAGNEDSDDILHDEEDIFEFIHPNSIYQFDQAKSKIKFTSTFTEETTSKWQDQEIEHISIEETHHNNDIDPIKNKKLDIIKDKENILHKKNVEILINEKIKLRLEKLIENQVDGIWCADLPEKYLEEYKVPLNYIELGFNSVREFASQLPEIFHCIQPYDTGDFKLYYAKSEIPSNKIIKEPKDSNIAKYYIYESTDEAIPASVSLDTCKLLIPDTVMSIGEYVEHINVTDLAQNEQLLVEVIVVEVFTPSFFWIQLRKKQNIFKTFMNDLNNFYAVQYEQYIIPPVVLEKGLNCVCIYNGIWHRGIIKTVKPDFQVTIMFYDYGTLKTYSPDAVYYLHRMFSTLPAQAIPCGLINTRPYKASKWSRSATHYFALRTNDIPLVATIATINTEDNSMMVTLTDTLEDEDVHINDWLVEQKLAEHGKMENKVDMSNLLLYVEENLILMPEKCYEKEANTFNGNNKKLSKSVTNGPLVTPQSTLNDILFKSSSQCMLFDEQKILPVEGNIQDQIFQNNSIPNVLTCSKNNPFLQTEPVYDQIDDISPKKFMQLWNENLQLQMQINTTLNILLNKVIEDSVKNEDLTNNKSTLNMIKSTFLNTNKQMPISVDSLYTNTENAHGNVISSNGNIYYEETTVKDPVKHNAINKQQLTSTVHNENHNPNAYIDSPQNIHFQNIDGNLNTINYNTLMSTSKDINTINQLASNQQISIKPNGLSESEKFNNRCFINTNLPMHVENSVHNETPFKETNPFRLSLAHKLKILPEEEKRLDFNDSLHTIHENNVVEYDLINFQDDNSNTNRNLDDLKNRLFNQYQYCVSDFSKDTSNIKNNSFATNANPFSDDVDDIINATSRIIINDKTTEYNVHKTEIEKQCFSKKSIVDSQFIEKAYTQESIHTIDISNSNQSLCIQNNDLVLSEETLDHKKYSKLANNTSINGEYLTCSSASHTLYGSSPTTKLNEVQNHQTSVINPVEAWNKTHENTVELNNYNKIHAIFEKNEDKAICNNDQQKNKIQNPENGSDFEVNNIRANDLYLKKTEFTVGKATQVPKYLSLNYRVFFQAVELPKQIIHIFHYREEGWLLISEFIQVFTESEITLNMAKLLHVFRINVQEIDRTENSVEFMKINSILSKTTYDIINGSDKLCLISMKSVLKVLCKLEIISQKDINDILTREQFVNGSIIRHKIWLIVNAYKEFKYYIGNGQ
ncbi:tudor domain-containing protein 5-like isoform X2 [Frieseomelitta varia]|uniref:tudor domain-containing protein 5-like isoform X2 n=1 Tax=Frieseomelitta varia TaxID=561572 RepID=UPI001CB69346|nr:tudor domain-containing protein 5-like isoform X2 [Frieseomelitta varia]